MATGYPDELNPFGDECDDQLPKHHLKTTPRTRKSPSNANHPMTKKPTYPEQLNPFDVDDAAEATNDDDDYDNSFNPFAAESDAVVDNMPKIDYDETLNPFDEDNEEPDRSLRLDSSLDHNRKAEQCTRELSSPTCRSHDGSTTNLSVDTRPKPFPRTKSLLKKEGKLIEDRKSNASQDQSVPEEPQDGGASSSGKIDEPATATETTVNPSSNVDKGLVVENNQDPHDSNQNVKQNLANGSVKRFEGRHDDRNAALWRKIGLKKRAAPPLPVNFKRQVFGSLVEIEAELNEIGDKLVDIEERFLVCETKMLEERSETNDSPKAKPADANTPIRLHFIELVKEKCDLARRQKDLMYKKREHILDQSHSDIEYELRMIGNKQASSRTDQDDQREQELLKRLVEIIEEKNDIVENLIKDNSISDEDELNKALKRLDIRSPSGESFSGQSAKDCDRKTAAFNNNQASHDASISKQDKSKNKHRPSTTKALKTLKKYGKVVVKMSKKDNDNAPKSRVTKTPL